MNLQKRRDREAEIGEFVYEAGMSDERRRIAGLILNEYAIWKQKGEERIAHVLGALASKIEHGDE